MSRPRFSRRFLLLLLAAGGALLSNFLFTGEWLARSKELSGVGWTGAQTAASWVLLAVIGLAAWSLGRADDFNHADGVSPRAGASGARVRAFAPAAISYVAALIVYLSNGETPLVHWLWIGGVVGLLVPLLREVDVSDFWPVPFWEYSLLILILTGAFVVRYVDLTQLPYHVDNDVSIMGVFSEKMIAANDSRWIGMAPTAHQFSEHQFLALSMQLFGVGHYGLVMLSVLAGTATCGLLYVLGRVMFNRWVGLIAASFLAINYVHLHFSRIIFGPISTFFVVLGGVFLMHGLRRANRLSFTLAGMSIGLGLLGYYSARVGPVIGFCVFGLWLWQRRRYPHVTLSCWALAVAGMFAVFGPNLVYGLTQTDSFHGRGNNVILWTDHAWNHLSQKYASGGSVWVVLKEQALRTLLAPFYFPDESTICYLRRPMLGVFACVSFALGLGFCMRRWREPAHFYLLTWIGLTFVLGGMLTIDPPFWPHLNIAVPAMALVGAIGLERFARSVILHAGRRAALLVPIGVTAGLLLTGIQNWDVYYGFARAHAGGRIHAMREIEKLSREHQVFIMSNDVRWEQETFQFFTPHVNGRNLSQTQLLANPPAIDRPTAFIIYDDPDKKALDYLTKTFPSARQQIFLDGWNWPVFTMVHVYPQGFVEAPQRQRKAPEALWNKPGWRYVSLIILGLLVLGWRALMRERGRGRAQSAPTTSAATRSGLRATTELKPAL